MSDKQTDEVRLAEEPPKCFTCGSVLQCTDDDCVCLHCELEKARTRIRELEALAGRNVMRMAEMQRDARRYQLLRDMKCNHFYLTRDADHAPNYMTADEYLESSHGHDWTKTVSAEELQRMKDANTVWCLQIYPDTPVGFVVYHGADMDTVVDAALGKEG